MEDYTYGQAAPVLASGECILWRGKPQKSAFVASKSLTMLPIAVIWLCLDSVFILAAARGDGPWFLIPFMLVHLMPVWIWLGSTITAGKRWKNTNYFVTNRRIIIQGGYLAVNETSLFYKDLRNAQLRIGLLNRIFHTGDIVFDSGGMHYQKNRQHGPVLEDLADAHAVYNRIQRIILDMQTDMAYPNAFRPETNPGYNTDYQP